MITLHHLENSRSQRVLWLLEELNLPYEIKFYKRDPVTMLAPKELINIHPLGKSPVISDDGRVIAESGAIIDYIVDKYGPQLKPTNEFMIVVYNYWLHYAEGSLMPPFLLKLIFSRMSKPPMPIFLRPFAAMIASGFINKYINPQLKRHLDFINSELSNSKYFVGDEFSAADIQMSFPLEAAASRVGLVDYPAIQKFLDLIHARPAYKRAIEKGGPFKL